MTEEKITVRMNMAMCGFHEMNFGRPDPECEKCQKAKQEFDQR